jgi:hypothetical protein
MPRSAKVKAAAFSPETHIRQREIGNQSIIFRLFFEKRF